MKDTLQHIITSIVEEPEAVEIVEEETEDGIISFSIVVAKNDMGRIIGKEGKVIRSIRNVMKIMAMKENKKINIVLSENPAE